jgi:hypothetical protein
MIISILIALNICAIVLAGSRRTPRAAQRSENYLTGAAASDGGS